MDSENPNEFYAKLKTQLEETSTWPSVYLYKFIVPTDGSGVSEIETIFKDTKAIIDKKNSKTGKYTSLSIRLIMDNADAVIEKYVAVGKVKGVISL